MKPMMMNLSISTRAGSRRLLIHSALALGALLVSPSGGAQTSTVPYPNRPVRLVVPYPPGGPTDIVARVVAAQLTESMGQPFVIENRAGAGGNIGAEAVARAAADGYTLLVATTAHAINMSLFRNPGYDVLKDFAPVSLLTQGPLVLVAHPGLSAGSVRELVAMAKARPGSLQFASSGNGQSTHLAGELFNTLAGVRLTHVPYKGSAPALNDVVAGQVPLMFDTMLSAMPMVRSGRLKALAVTGAQRSPAAPELPTLAESGLAGYQVYAWNGLLAPQGTPPAIIARLNEELRKAMQLPMVRDKFSAQGFAASWGSPEQAGAFVRAEVEQWSRTVKASGASLD